jgi:ABC-type multidrug transport system fused ATPase/permease subunit
MMTQNNSKALPLLKRIFTSYIKPYIGDLVVALFWMVVASGMTGVFAWIIGPVMDDIMVQGNETKIFPIAGLLFVRWLRIFKMICLNT